MFFFFILHPPFQDTCSVTCTMPCAPTCEHLTPCAQVIKKATDDVKGAKDLVCIPAESVRSTSTIITKQRLQRLEVSIVCFECQARNASAPLQTPTREV